MCRAKLWIMKTLRKRRSISKYDIVIPLINLRHSIHCMDKILTNATCRVLEKVSIDTNFHGSLDTTLVTLSNDDPPIIKHLLKRSFKRLHGFPAGMRLNA